jgi:protein-tyrosine phosphatase
MAPTCIYPNLFLGNIEDARQYKSLGFDCIVSIIDGDIGFDASTPHFFIKLVDSQQYAKYISMDTLRKVCLFIDENLKRNKKILVHCMAGISRSATLIIAYKMYRESIPFLNAYDQVKSLRPIISPNSGFIIKLVDWEYNLILKIKSK